MSQYNAVNILDMADAIGEDALKNILSDFSCQKNFEIENYVKKNALDFARQKCPLPIWWLMKKVTWWQFLL